MSLDPYLPEDDPNWHDFWEHRPFGPDWSLNPISRDWPYHISWHVALAGVLHSWTHYTGMGVSANMALGELIWGPPHVQMYGKHIYQRGASPTFTTGLVQSIAANPLAYALPVLAVGSAAGWIATAEQHGAVTPGVASGFGMPITNPGAAHSPAPYRQGLRDMFGLN